MGWKGAVRSFGATVRAAERNAKRRQRELALQEKSYNRMQALEQAAYEVDVYTNHIDLIRSIHKECGDPVDWRKTAQLPEPRRPTRDSTNEERVRTELAKYRPSFIDRLFKGEVRKRKSLSEAVDAAVLQDSASYEKDVEAWEAEHRDWVETVRLSKEVLTGSAKANLEAIQKIDPFTEISNLGSSLSFSADEKTTLRATIKVHGSEIIPREVKSLLQSGKLSVKQMPRGQFHELHQDYVCGCVLRVARELFAILPEQMLIVTATDALLDNRTGHLQEKPILSVLIPRNTLESLNFDRIDPSDSIKNFVHQMTFKKTTGFEAVDAIDPLKHIGDGNS